MINWESIDFGEFEKAQSQNSSERRARHYFCPVWPLDDKLACILFANKDMYTALLPRAPSNTQSKSHSYITTNHYKESPIFILQILLGFLRWLSLQPTVKVREHLKDIPCNQCRCFITRINSKIMIVERRHNIHFIGLALF